MTSDDVLTEQGQQCLQALMRVWFEFERQLGRVPIIQRLERGQLTMEDYQKLLLNLRQQVVEGARWMTRSASSFDRNYRDVRSQVISHAREEHKDFEILERDYVATGGNLDDIQSADRNPGTEALHAFLMYRASQPNPIDMLGAMWIIEGLGQKMATGWAQQIDAMTQSKGDYTRFMHFHGTSDDAHIGRLYQLLDRVCETEAQQKSIVRTAKVVGRLYAMQLELIDD